MNEIKIPVSYFTQSPDPCVNLYDNSKRQELNNRQFEWSDCGYYQNSFEQELTSSTLNSENLPEALSGGSKLSNRGVKSENFARWFHETELSTENSGEIILTNKFENHNNKNENLNTMIQDLNLTFENYVPTSELFTLHTSVPLKIQKSGLESFEITADDDTWVFLDQNLVLDLGGIHEAITANFSIRENGEVYTSLDHEDEAYSGIKLENSFATLRIFHANRDSGTTPTFTFALENLAVDTDALTAAENNGYVEPLGETLTVMGVAQARAGQIFTDTAIIMGAFLAALILIFAVRKYWRRAHNLVK